MRRLGVFFLVVATVLAISSAALAGGRPFSTDLTGAAERPGPGDPDGSGHISLTINPGQREVCYDMHVADVAPIFAAHIHVAGVDDPGPVVVDLMPVFDADGDASACVTGDRAVLVAIMANPAGYYVNVHNADFPDGALRGQLG